MSYDREDSDFEVCLTSREYTRILAIEKESKKEKDEFRQARQEYIREIECLKNEVSVYECALKGKNHEIDELVVECLRLKKLRITNEDQIRAFKEEQLRIKEANLTELENSVRENKEMKEKRVSDETIIADLRVEINRLVGQNVGSTEKFLTRIKQFQLLNHKLVERIECLNNQLQDSRAREKNGEMKLNEMVEEIDRLSISCKNSMKQVKRVEVENEKLAMEVRQREDYGEKIKMSYQFQLKDTSTQMSEIIKQKEEEIQKLKVQMDTLFVQIDQMKVDNAASLASFEKGSKFSSRVYQALQWIKDGVLDPKELKDQIDSILVLEKEYEDIIHQDSLKIKSLEQVIIELEAQGKQLANQNSTLKKSKKDGKQGIDQSILMSQNLALKQESERMARKLEQLTAEFDESVKSFNYEISDMQLKNEKQLAGYTELKNEIEATKLHHQDLLNEIEAGIKRFGVMLRGMKELDPYKILNVLKESIPRLTH